MDSCQCKDLALFTLIIVDHFHHSAQCSIVSLYPDMSFFRMGHIDWQKYSYHIFALGLAALQTLLALQFTQPITKVITGSKQFLLVEQYQHRGCLLGKCLSPSSYPCHTLRLTA